ncbi:MAG: hypothetical protein WKF59_01310 [Chitinophagaceae bacterium]
MHEGLIKYKASWIQPLNHPEGTFESIFAKMVNEAISNLPLFNSSDNKTSTWAQVILPLAIPKTYTYTIPAHLQLKTKPGCRAEVVFGKNKKYAGIVKSISEKNRSMKQKRS